MKAHSVIVVFLSILKFAFPQESYVEADTEQDVNSSVAPASDNEVVREQRSFFKKLCKGGGLFGHKGHHCSYGHHHGPSENDYGHGHSYSGHYGGGYGGGYGGNNEHYGGGYGTNHGSNYGANYFSKPYYGGIGLNKPGLSYSIGGYNKSPGYGSSYPSSGSSYPSSGSPYPGSSGYNSGYTSGGYNSGYSGGGYSSGYPSKPHYSSSAYSDYSHNNKKEEEKHGKETYSKEQADLYSDKHEKNEYEKSNYASHKHNHSGYTKPVKEETSKESSSSEEDDSSSGNKFHYKSHGQHKEGNKKEHKTSSIVPVPYIPVVSQPVFYIPQVPTVSVVPPVAYSDYNAFYTSYFTGDYSTSGCGTSSCYYPNLGPYHYPRIYKPATYPTHSDAYVAPYSAYPTIPAPIAPAQISPALTYATAVPSYQNSPYSLPVQQYAAAPATPCTGNQCGLPQSYAPTYTVTSFDVQTITTPYQPVVAGDIKTFAKSGSSMASANGPPGYVLSALASRPLEGRDSDKKDDNDSSSEEHKTHKVDYTKEVNEY